MSGFDGLVTLREPVQARGRRASLAEVAKETFAETIETNPSTALWRLSELDAAYQRRDETLDAETARARLAQAGLAEHIQIPDDGIPWPALDILMQRKREELRRAEVYSRGRGGAVGTSTRVAVALGGSLLDPLNIASAFVPVVGEARYAQMIARSGGIAGRTAVRVGVGAAEGLAGAALVEPIIASSKSLEQADYDMSDSLLNIGFGGAFGAGLHTVGGAVGDAWTYSRASAGDVVGRVAAETRAQALRTAIAQAASGERVNVDPLVSLDPDAVGMPFDARLAEPYFREQLLAMRGLTGMVEEGGRMIRDESGAAIARTAWAPRSEWWADRPHGMSESEVQASIDKALAGQHLGNRQRDMVEYLIEVAEEQRPIARPAVESGAEGPRAPLSAADQAIETRFREQLSDVDAAIKAYAELPESQGGRVLNTDIARELSADYRADRTRSAAVHDPASSLVKEMYRRKLEEPPANGEYPLVVFTAGGTGAGKSSGLDVATGINPAIGRAQIIYDTNMNTFASAAQKVDQALEAGKSVQIVFTYRDPAEAFTAGMLKRATRMERDLGSGRTVPINEHAKTHAGSTAVIKQLADRYADDPRVFIDAIDNSRGKGNARPMDVENVPGIDYNSLRESLPQILESERAAGRISESVYLGVRGGAGVDQSAAVRVPTAARVLDRQQSQQSQLDAVRQAVEGPRLSTVADERAADQGDTFLADNPEPDDQLAAVNEETADILAELKETGGEDFDQAVLAEYDELMADAKSYGAAARAAVLCGFDHVA